MSLETVPCPSCRGDAHLADFIHIVRRGDRTAAAIWKNYVCGQGCHSERSDDPLAFVTESLDTANREASDAAWLAKYGEHLPPAGRPGRPNRAGERSSERVPVLFTPEELQEIDRRRGDMSRSAYVRQATLGRR